MRLTTFFLAAAALAGPALAQDSVQPGQESPPADLPRGPIDVLEPPTDPGIAWFGTWAAARAEAKRTGRPILFMSAAPQCKGTPGVW